MRKTKHGGHSLGFSRRIFIVTFLLVDAAQWLAELNLPLREGLLGCWRQNKNSDSSIVQTFLFFFFFFFFSKCVGRSESGVDTTFPFPRKHRSSNDTGVSLASAAHNDDVFDCNGDASNKDVTARASDQNQRSSIPRIEIS